MATIHQDVLVRSWISCDVPDCPQAYHVDEQVQDNAVRYTDATIGYARQLSEGALRDQAKIAGWLMTPQIHVCPSHVYAAVYAHIRLFEDRAKQATAATGD